MTLPDIPDEALHAAVESAAIRSMAAIVGDTYPGDLETAAMSAALYAAWPHLYAAAIRHAADYAAGRDGDPNGLVSAKVLRRLADGAVQ